MGVGVIEYALRRLGTAPGMRGFIQRASRVLGRVGYNSSYDFTTNGEIATAAPFLAGSPLLLDVGANNGDWAAAFMEHYPGARVYLVEANPGLVGRLRERFAGDHKVNIINTALSSREGTATFRVPRGKDTHASLEAIEVGRTDMEIEEIVVKTQTGDKLLSEMGITRVDFLKIDVEGHELHVIDGFNESLRKGIIRNVQFEYSEINLEQRIYLRDICARLCDYEVGRIFPDFIDFKPYELTDENFIPGNFFAKRKY